MKYYILTILLLLTSRSEATNAEHLAGGLLVTAVVQGFAEGPLHLSKPQSRTLSAVAGVAAALTAGMLDRKDKIGERMLYGVGGVAIWEGFSIGFDF